MARERWLPVPIPGYAGDYSVSDRGRISRDTQGLGTPGSLIVQPRPSRGGHPIVTLSAGGVPRTFAVASLVADAFLPPRPRGGILRHGNGDVTDCHAANLGWTTRRDPAISRGGAPGKLSPETRDAIRAAKATITASEAARKFGVSRSAIRYFWGTL